MHNVQRSSTPLASLLTLGLVLGAAACGTSAAFGGPGGSTGSGGSGNTTTTTTTSSSSEGGALVQGGAAPGGAGGQGAQGGAGAGGPGGSGQGGATVLVDCDGVSCPAGPQSACCWDQYGAYEGPRGECVTGTDATDACTTSQTGEGWETRIECQLPSDCAVGQICCGDWKQGWYQGQQYSYYEDLTCQPACDYPSLWICDPSAPPSDDCPIIPNGTGGTVQSVCEPSQLLPPGYHVCGLP